MEDFLGLKKGAGTGTAVLSRSHIKYPVRSLNARAHARASFRVHVFVSFVLRCVRFFRSAIEPISEPIPDPIPIPEPIAEPIT